jgi:hypothetical protein
MRITIAGLGVVLTYLYLPSSGVRAQGPPPETGTALSVCEVLSRPLAFDGRMVTIRGTEEGTDEGAWLVGRDCPGRLVTEGHVWPSVIALTMPDVPVALRVHSVDFEFDFGSEDRAERRLQLLAPAPKECLAFTYTGLFETRRDWSRAKLVYPNGTWKFAGFGHLGEAPAQILLKSADDVSLLPGCAKAALAPAPTSGAQRAATAQSPPIRANGTPLGRAIDLSASYLENACGPAGKFAYRLDP